MKKIIIIGATSGIGYQLARLYIERGWQVGIAGRRVELLEKLQKMAPDRVNVAHLDVTSDTAVNDLLILADKMNGMDILFLSSGIGNQNRSLDNIIEQQTAATNVQGFMQIVNAAYHYFSKQGHGHIAVISSIAGTKGLGISPAYSATKAFQNSYMEALEQLIRMNKLNINVTDIRPGFVRTPLLKDRNYPLLMEPQTVAHHIINAIDKRKRVQIIDWRYRIIVFFWQMMPSWLWVRLTVSTKR